uniref:Uncharacterized protein n=1 Tax=Mycena chlorophos TaxID=658473 RepID=A0ABQ0LP38_MYCCL|nr:predicted protein [Mycena chlorophos]
MKNPRGLAHSLGEVPLTLFSCLTPALTPFRSPFGTAGTRLPSSKPLLVLEPHTTTKSVILEFLRTQPSIVERLLRHVETPSFVDLLVRIIQLDEQPGGVGVLEWLSSEQLVPRLLALLSPTQPPDVHTVVAELIKGIIAMATPTPSPGIAKLHAAPASNLFARQLASPENVEVLIEYLMIEFPPPENETDGDMETEKLPHRASCASSVVHSISWTIIIELIRKNNSNYFEPYLFHTLRNRLIQVQQRLTTNSLEIHAILIQDLSCVHISACTPSRGCRGPADATSRSFCRAGLAKKIALEPKPPAATGRW